MAIINFQQLTAVVLVASAAYACGSSGTSGGNPDSGVATDSESGSSGSSGSTDDGATGSGGGSTSSSGGGSGSGSSSGGTSSSSGSSPSDGGPDSGSSSDGGVADSGSSSDGGEAGAGACIDAADMAAASMASFQTSTLSCNVTNLGAEPATLNCLEGLGLTSACATCYDGNAQCTDAHCETQCETNHSSAACMSCTNTNCLPAFHTCSGT